MFELHEGWYFVTRERINVGPFRSVHDATRAADALAQRIAAEPGDARKFIVELLVSLYGMSQ